MAPLNRSHKTGNYCKSMETLHPLNLSCQWSTMAAVLGVIFVSTIGASNTVMCQR